MLVIIVAIAAFFFLRNSQPTDSGICPVDQKPPTNTALKTALGVNINTDYPLECYFSDGYFSARDQFRRLASAAHAEMSSMDVVDGLTTDIAIFRGDPGKFVIHISGTHGVEAYSGSASQAAFLDYIAKEGLYQSSSDANLPTLVFVHALNPFGFANNRRVNEDNVDLNRNILTDAEFHFVQSRDPNYAGYVDLDSQLNPTSKFHDNHLINEAISYFTLGRAIMKYGLTSLKKALVSGNYHKQRGVGFGGFEQTKSVKNLIHLLVDELQIPVKAKDFILLDVHTGLGPEGVDTLMYQGTAEYVQSIEQTFPTEYADKAIVGGIKVEEFAPSPLPEKRSEKLSKGKAVDAHAKDVASGYELTVGTVSGSLCSNYLTANQSGTKFLCITQVRLHPVTPSKMRSFGNLSYGSVLPGVWYGSSAYRWHGKLCLYWYCRRLLKVHRVW